MLGKLSWFHTHAMLSLLGGSTSRIDPESHVGMCIHMKYGRIKTVCGKRGSGRSREEKWGDGA